MTSLKRGASEGAGPSNYEELIERLRRHVDRLAGLIGPRHVGCLSALDAAASLIERELSHCGYTVQRQAYAVHGVAGALFHLCVT